VRGFGCCVVGGGAIPLTRQEARERAGRHWLVANALATFRPARRCQEAARSCAGVRMTRSPGQGADQVVWTKYLAEEASTDAASSRIMQRKEIRSDWNA